MTRESAARALAVALVALGAGLVTPAAAQSPSGAGWNAWLGCWEPVRPAPLGDDGVRDAFADVPAEATALCVLPTASPSRVELVTVEDGVIVGRETLDASGAGQRREIEGCTGSETFTWSADGTRIYRSASFDCPGELERRTSGVFAINPRREWVAVEAVSVAGGTDVRVVRYRPSSQLEQGNREISAALEGRALAIDAARTAAAAPTDLADVVEASRALDVAAVEGWLIEHGDGFDLDADRLLELARAGVPEPVIDLVVALSYPEVFAINRSAREGEMREREGFGRPRRGVGPVYFPAYRGGFYPGYWGGYYGRPVIIVRDPDIDVDRGGRAVNGRGYTRRGTSGSTGTPAEPRTSVGGSSGGPSSGAPGGGGSSTGRTAKPR